MKCRNDVIRLGISVALAVLLAAPLLATNYVWTGSAGDSNWMTSANWVTNRVTAANGAYPGTNDVATLTNNDGRQDVLLLYSSGAPRAFFNRGFRSFGVSYSLDMGAGELLSGIENGQVAGCMADFNGDGTEDLAVVLTNGVCAVITRDPAGAEQCARVVLSPQAGKPGPLRLYATAGKRVLGAWNLTAGAAPAFVTRVEAGAIQLTWQFPGNPEGAKEIILENKPQTVVIGAAAN